MHTILVMSYVPCVNATGRLDTARHALRLFETGQETEAEEIARDLVDLNQERKELTLQGVEMAKKLCEEGGYENDPVLVLFLPDVHESIAGLIAGRIREMYNRPVFVLTRGEEGVKGSGRSTENYSMYENMCGCAELFTKFGGHPMAAGLSLPEENVEKFRRKINENCPLTVEEVCPDIHIDMAMPVGYASTELVHQFALLEPFGKDNPSPLFADRNLSISRMWLIGKNRNVLRMSVLSNTDSRFRLFSLGMWRRCLHILPKSLVRKRWRMRCMAEKTGFYFLWCIQQRLIFIREMKICSWR